jgi:tetratricopeptide (TPR) repeat protein
MPQVNSEKLQQLFKLLEREPNDTFLLYGIGMEYKKLDALPTAIEYFDRVIAADAGYCYAYFQKGQVFEKMNDPQKAKQAYRDGIAAAKRAGDAHAQSELEAALDMLA